MKNSIKKFTKLVTLFSVSVVMVACYEIDMKKVYEIEDEVGIQITGISNVQSQEECAVKMFKDLTKEMSELSKTRKDKLLAALKEQNITSIHFNQFESNKGGTKCNGCSQNVDTYARVEVELKDGTIEVTPQLVDFYYDNGILIEPDACFSKVNRGILNMVTDQLYLNSQE